MRLEWDRGGSARFVALEPGDRVLLRSTVAAAPGTPLTGVTEEGVRYSVKVRSCRKIADDPVEFEVSGRLWNLTRAMREALSLALRPPSAEP